MQMVHFHFGWDSKVVPVGLSPTIHVLDQIKVIDRFRGMILVTSSWWSLTWLARNTPWRCNGWFGMVWSGSWQGRVCHFCSVSLPLSMGYDWQATGNWYCKLVERDIHSARLLSIDSSKWITWVIFYEHISCVMLDIRYGLEKKSMNMCLYGYHDRSCSMISFQQSGQHPTIVTDVETWHPYWKWE